MDVVFINPSCLSWLKKKLLNLDHYLKICVNVYHLLTSLWNWKNFLCIASNECAHLMSQHCEYISHIYTMIRIHWIDDSYRLMFWWSIYERKFHGHHLLEQISYWDQRWHKSHPSLPPSKWKHKLCMLSCIWSPTYDLSVAMLIIWKFYL